MLGRVGKVTGYLDCRKYVMLRENPLHRGTGHGMVTGAEFGHRTRTRMTRHRNTAGSPVPVLHLIPILH